MKMIYINWLFYLQEVRHDIYSSLGTSVLMKNKKIIELKMALHLF